MGFAGACSHMPAGAPAWRRPAGVSLRSATSSRPRAWLLRRRRWRWSFGVERRFEPRPVRLTLHDEVVGRVLEAVDRALREQHVVEHREPLGGVAIARD